ncbi:MAG: aldo/keto reductase [Eubacteriales bacterium]
MKMRDFGKLGIRVSAFGLGCMRFPMTKDAHGKDIVDEATATQIIRTAIDGGVNYVDTAYVYSGGLNESYVGKALADGYREKVYLATKLPTWKCNSKDDMYACFEEQCARLGTDHIDFYLVHSLNLGSWNKVKDLGVREFLDDLKASGRIRFACFSFHDGYDAFENILNDYDWDMCQLQFNYMDVDNQAGLKGVRLAGEKGVPVVVMEGLLGGKLANVPPEVAALFEQAVPGRSAAEWAFRWLANFPEVATVLSGVTDLAQTRDNLRIFDGVQPGGMSEAELAVIDRARELYRKRIRVGCTGCAYCMPCPKNVEIPKVFSLWNSSYMYGVKDHGYAQLEKENKSAAACVSCGKCMKICPQKLEIPALLREAHAYFSGN